jgi:hypothetical protein
VFVPSLPWQNDRFYTIKTAPKRRFSHHIACEALSGSPLGPFTRHRPTRLPFLRITGDIFESCSVQSHRHPHRSQQQSKAHGQLQSRTAGGFAAQCTSASVHVILRAVTCAVIICWKLAEYSMSCRSQRQMYCQAHRSYCSASVTLPVMRKRCVLF